MRKTKKNSATYEAACVAYSAAFAKFTDAVLAKSVADAEFLAAKKEHYAAAEVFDKAIKKETKK